MAINQPLIYLGTAFNADPFDGAATPTWTDLTSRFIGLGTAARGRQYELDQVQAGTMDPTWLNIDEALNPVNTGSPYSPNVVPYRQTIFMAQWPPAPVGGAVNLLNLLNPDYTIDPSFESYAAGTALPFWFASGGGVAPVVTTTNPFQGTKAVSYAVSNTGGFFGIGLNIPCIPGKQYTSSWYVRQSAANTTQIFINGGAAGTSTTTINAYVRLTVTFTATQPVHQLYIGSFTTGTSGTVFCDAIQHEPGAAANTFTTSGPLLRNIWRGYTERFPTRWDSNGYEGQSTTPVVGPFAILNNAYLHTEIRNAIMAKLPAYYWPLTEPNGAVTFAEASGNNGPPLQKVTAPVGAGSSVFTPGTQTNVAGDPSGVGVRTAPLAGDEGTFNKPFQQLQLGYASTSQRLTGAQTASGTPGAWALTSAFVAVRPAAMVNGGSGLVRFADPLRNTSASFWSGGGASLISCGNASIADIWGDGKPHLYVNVITLTTAAGGTYTNTGYVDGAQVSTFSFTGAGAQPAADMGLSIGGETTYTFSRPWQDQTVSHVAYWNRALSAFEIADLTNGFKGYSGELTGARISRYLSLANYLGPTKLATGSSQLGVSTLTENATVLSACQLAASSEFGNFFEGAAGVTFQARFARYLTTTSAYTIGDLPSGSEYPYLGDINFDIDPNLVINIADVTQSAGIVAHAEDATGASQKRYGRKNFTRTVSLLSANETIDAATWVVNNGKVPKNRVNGVTLDPAATVNLPFGDGTMWAMIIGLEIGTRVTLRRRPKAANAGAGITMSGDYFIEQISHHDINIENSTWQTTLQLSPVPAGQPWILENATYGQLDVTTVLAF